MQYTIIYYSDAIQADILDLPEGLRGRYLALTDRMKMFGANLGEPHTKLLAMDYLNCGLKVPKALPVCFIALWLANVS